MPKVTDEEYVLGTHEAELARLGLQHRLWSESAFGCWERAGIGPGKHVLEIGCGPGFTTLDLASLVQPGGRVTAYDVSPRFIEHLRGRVEREGIQGVEASVADAQTLELPEAAFDAVYIRWVLCFVVDPEAIVASAARALRPGGVLAVQEYSNYTAVQLAPETPAFRRVIRAVDESWILRGGDPNVGTRLPGMMHRSGLKVEEVRPLVRIARPGTPLWSWPESFLQNNVPMLVETGVLSQAEADAFFADWEAHRSDPGAFFTTPPMVEVLGVRG